MPRAGADDVGVRDFFIAPEGCVLLSLDFSQIELRVGAFYCRDERMLETYRVGGDIHDQTATVIYGPGTHDKEQRTIAKNVNFGTFYGLFPSGLMRTLKFKAGLDITLEQCERIIAGLPDRPWLRPLLQIHDELVFEVPAERISEAVAFIKACMEARPFEAFDVPIAADAAVGGRFGELKELEDYIK